MVSREYKPAAAPRVQFVNPPVGCSGPRGSWASTLSQSSLEERYVRVQQSQQYPPRADRGQAARWVILQWITHCLAVRGFALGLVPQITIVPFWILSRWVAIIRTAV